MSSDSGTMDGEPKGGPEMEESIADRVASLVESCRLLKDAASAHSTRWQHETDALSKQAVTHVNTLKKLQGDVSSASEKDDINQQTTDKVFFISVESPWRRNFTKHGLCFTMETWQLYFLPRPTVFFLRMLLGPANVRATRKDSRYKVKEEYNAYRDRTAVMFLAFPVILLILKNRIWNGCFPALPVQVYQAWLLFFYTSLALRENILRVNGSDIRPWWVYHHYCAMVMALVSLTWGIQGHPSCIRKQQGVRLFLGWAVMQGVAMLLQNRYQRRRLYTRIALGKAGRMDVVWGETAGVKGQLWVLYPLLFILQGFQFFIGILLLKTAILEDESEWQMVVCGLLLILMACGNFVNTVATLVAKAKIKSKMKKKGKQVLQRMTSKKSL
nr:transmembrane protein 120 homolog isoform X2 [Physcomitrium patens]|eukprot:XP_024385292.1 transmembrane protein 120 homolog isoform X2 [Physcomitrella patens]